jgi:hypothetical protein
VVPDPVAHGTIPEGPAAGFGPSGPARAGSLESAGRALAAATAAGAVLGVLIGGIGGRLAMSLLASLNPEDKGVISDDGFEMGQVTLGGTAQLLLATLQLGLVAALIYLALRGLALGPTWVRLASLTAGGTVVFGALVIHEGVDFTRLEPSWLPVVLFLAIPIVFIPAAAVLTDYWLRPASWFNTADRRKVGAVLVAWLATGLLLPVAALVLGAAFLARQGLGHLSARARSAAAWVARGVLGAVGVVALVALVADIDTYT